MEDAPPASVTFVVTVLKHLCMNEERLCYPSIPDNITVHEIRIRVTFCINFTIIIVPITKFGI